MEQREVDEQYMRKALQEAEAACQKGEIPIGAVVVCKGRIISRAHNLTETLHDVTAHAEMQAITAAATRIFFMLDISFFCVCWAFARHSEDAHRLKPG